MKAKDARHGPERLTKQGAIQLFDNRAQLARALGITRGAVTNWPEDKPIPINRELQLRLYICPEKFEGGKPRASTVLREMLTQ